MNIVGNKAVLLTVGLIVFAFVILLSSRPATTPSGNPVSSTQSENSDQAVIRSFMGTPNLELSFVNTDLPTPYFRVGKVTQMDGGENMEAVDGWVRKINVYDQKELLNGRCSVHEYHTDERNHKLTAVLIKGLKPSEVDSLKAQNLTCVQDSGNMQKITKPEAESVAMEYLQRSLPNFDEIKDRFVYTSRNNGESHEWLWEDKNYQLPEGLTSRPYQYPIIRISVYGNGEIQYWNTVSLFEN